MDCTNDPKVFRGRAGLRPKTAPSQAETAWVMDAQTQKLVASLRDIRSVGKASTCLHGLLQWQLCDQLGSASLQAQMALATLGVAPKTEGTTAVRDGHGIAS